MSSIEPSDMDTSSSPLSSPTLSARPLASTPVEHPLYHFHDGSLAFELEGVNYRVHSSLLARHCDFASTWAQDLRDPVSAGIPRADLDAFFSMIYLATYDYPDLNLPAENWASILRLAARWKSDGMRTLAITRLAGDLSPFDKLVFCRKYNVPGWLAPACAALALRPTPLTMEEAEQLEKSDIMRIFLSREAVSKGSLTATEEAIGTWITGFLSNASEKAGPASVAAAPGLVPGPSPPSLTAATCPPPEHATSFPVQQLHQIHERTVDALDKEEKEEPRSSPGLETLTSISSQSEETPPPSQEAANSLVAGPSSIKASYASIAEATSRPALNANASPFNLSSFGSLSPAPQSSLSTTASVVQPQTANDPSLPVRTPEEMTVDAVEAIREQRYDQALESLTLDNVKAVAIQVAPSLVTFVSHGPADVKKLKHLVRAIMRRVFNQNGFMQRGVQFIAALSTRSALRSIRFEVLLHDDMQSLSSKWALFRAGGQPTADLGGVMVDLSTNERKVYQDQMGHGRGFFRTLVRLGVLPGTNHYVEMLVQSHPSRPNP